MLAATGEDPPAPALMLTPASPPAFSCTVRPPLQASASTPVCRAHHRRTGYPFKILLLCYLFNLPPASWFVCYASSLLPRTHITKYPRFLTSFSLRSCICCLTTPPPSPLRPLPPHDPPSSPHHGPHICPLQDLSFPQNVSGVGAATWLDGFTPRGTPPMLNSCWRCPKPHRSSSSTCT